MRGAFYDITERKSPQARLLAANETLEAVSPSASQLAAISAGWRTQSFVSGFCRKRHEYAIFTLDFTGQVASWNPGAQRIKGYTREEIVGHHFSRFYSEEDRRNGARLALEPRRGPASETEGWRMRKDGSRFWASALSMPYDTDGRVISFKVTRDLTERRS